MITRGPTMLQNSSDPIKMQRGDKKAASDDNHSKPANYPAPGLQ